MFMLIFATQDWLTAEPIQVWKIAQAIQDNSQPTAVGGPPRHHQTRIMDT